MASQAKIWFTVAQTSEHWESREVFRSYIPGLKKGCATEIIQQCMSQRLRINRNKKEYYRSYIKNSLRTFSVDFHFYDWMPTVVLRQNAEQDRELRVIYKNAYDKIKEYLYTDKIADDIYYCHFTKQRNTCPLFIFCFFHKKTYFLPHFSSVWCSKLHSFRHSV